jgi:hypothetical protein
LAERPYGWVIVGVATICLTLGFGTNSTISVFMKPFEQEFGWSRADISMAFTLLTVGCAIGGIVWAVFPIVSAPVRSDTLGPLLFRLD